MTSFEYQIIEVAADDVRGMARKLNEAGAEGWEAVTSWGIKKGITRDTSAVVLKRLVADPLPPPPP